MIKNFDEEMEMAAGILTTHSRTCEKCKHGLNQFRKKQNGNFHFSVKAISRSAGRSAVACSAYRSGEKLEDHYQGKIQDYTQKQVWNLKKSMHLKTPKKNY
jgi:hypothetical protein